MKNVPPIVVLALTASIGLFAWADGSSQEDPWTKTLADLRNPDLAVRRKAAESFPLPDVGMTPEQPRALRGRLTVLEPIIRDRNEDSQVRERLIHGLAVFADFRANFRAAVDFAVPSLIDVARDQADVVAVRAEAVAALPYIGTIKQVESLILAETSDPNEIIRVAAFGTIAVRPMDIDPEILLPLLSRAMDDPSRHARQCAVALAGNLLAPKKDQRALPLLLRGVHDRDVFVKRAAAAMLQGVGPAATDAEAALVALLKDADPSTRASSAVALMKITGDAAKSCAFLSEMLRSKEAADREAAAQALVTGGPEAKAAVPALKDALHDPAERVRVHAATALMEVTGKAADCAPILIEALGSKDEMLQWWAGGALDLVAMRDPTVLKPLIREAVKHPLGLQKSLDRATALDVFSAALRDEDIQVRVAALESLAAMGPEALPVLPEVKKNLADPSEEVRETAKEAVRKIGGK